MLAIILTLETSANWATSSKKTMRVGSLYTKLTSHMKTASLRVVDSKIA